MKLLKIAGILLLVFWMAWLTLQIEVAKTKIREVCSYANMQVDAYVIKGSKPSLHPYPCPDVDTRQPNIERTQP
jgi:hypothetical protein